MSDQRKTKKQLIEELNQLRQQIYELNDSRQKEVQPSFTEHSQTEKALRESEEKCRQILNSSPNAITVTDLTGKIIECNQATADLYRFSSREELIGLNSFELVAPEDREQAYKNLENVLKEGSLKDHEISLITRDGYIFPSEISVTTISDTNGSPVSMMAITKDISARKKAEKALQESVQFNRAVIEHSPIGISVRNSTGKLLSVNAAWRRIWGISDDEINDYMEKESSELSFDKKDDYLGEWQPQVEQIYRKGGLLHIHEIKLKDYHEEKPRWISQTFYAIKDDDRKVDRVVILTDDITERIHAEEGLKKSEEKYTTLFSEARDGIVLIDAQTGSIIECNRQFEILTDRTIEQLKTLKIWELRPPEKEAAKNVYYEITKKGKGRSAELELQQPDGSIVHVEFTSTVLTVENRKIVQSIVRDITERKQAEETLETQKQRLDYILKGTNVGTWEWNVQTGETTFNERWAEIIGYTLKELAPVSIDTWMKFAHPDDLKVSGELLEKHFKDEMDYYECEARMRHKNGDWIWVLDRGKVVRWTEDGKPLLMSGTHTDITERKQAEYLIHAQHELALKLGTATGLDETLRLCVETAIRSTGMDAGGIYLVDEQSGDLNLAYSRGLSPEFIKTKSHFHVDAPNTQLIMVGKPIHINYQELDLPISEEDLQEGLRAIAILPIHHEDRVIACLNISSHTTEEISTVVRNTLETMAAQIGSFIARARTEEALRDSLQTSDDIVKAIPSGLLIYQYEPPDRLILIDANPEAIRLTHLDIDQCRGKEAEEIWQDSPQGSVKEAFLSTLKTGIPYITEELLYEDNRLTGAYRIRAFTLPGSRLGVAFEDIGDRKKAEEEIRISEERFRQLAEASWEGIAIHKDVLLHANNQYFKMLGYEPHELLGKNALSMTIIPESLANIDEQIQNGYYGPFEATRVRKDGTEFPSESRVRKINYQGEEVYVAAVRDMTAHKQSEDAIRKSEQRFREIAENIEEVFWIGTPDWNEIFYISPTYEKIWKQSCKSLYTNPRSWIESIHPDDKDTLIAFLDEKIASSFERVTFPEYRIVRPDGSERWIYARATAVRNDDDEIIRIVGIAEDITDRKLVEEALLAEKERTREYLDIAGVMILAIDANERVTLVNQKGCDILGYTEEDIIGKNWFKNFLPANQIEHTRDIYKNFMNGEISPVEYAENPVVTVSGEERIIAWHNSMLQDENGQIIGTLSSGEDITVRRKTEQALRESEERYRNLVESAEDAIYTVSTEGIISSLNPAFETVTGLSRKDWIGRSFLEILHPDDHPYAMELFTRMMKGEQPETHELRVRSGSEGWRTGEFRETVLQKDDQIIGILGIARDITERKKTELALLHSEKNLSRAQEIAQLGSWEWEFKSDQLHWSKEMYQIYGIDPSTEPSVDILKSLMHPADLPAFEKRLSDAFKGELDDRYEYRIVRTDGDQRYISSKSETFYDNDGKAVRLMGTVQDVTDSKQAEEEIKKFKALADNATYGVTISELDGTLMYVNETFAFMHGYTIEELQGKNLEVLHNSEQLEYVKKVIHDLQRIGSFSSLEVWHKHRDGSVFPTLMNGVIIMDNAGQPQYMASSASDITEIKQLQDFAERAKRLETAGRIAGQVAHDFNNLLGPLVAYPQLLREELGADHPSIQYIDSMEQAAEQMADINEQLLTLGRRGHYSQVPINLNEIVQQVIQQIDSPPDTLIIDTNLEQSLMNIMGGHSQIARVISNLLTNARDAVQDIGRITIKTENYYSNLESLGYDLIPVGEYIKLTISDTGCGIPSNVQTRIFDPFMTAKTSDKKRGSGLGLSVVDAVVKDHKGFIDMKSSVGEGTSFYLYFPITREVSKEPAQDDIQGGTETILIVDDDKVQRDVSYNLLSKLGYNIMAVENGETAIEHIKANPCDLLILDMVMPPGIDGTETYRQALEIDPSQKAIIVSGFAETERVEAAIKMGAGTFLKKPLTLSRLAITVRTELDKVVEKTR